MSLFRKEVLEHKRQQLFGDLIVQKPLSFTMLAWGSAVCIILVVSYLVWGQYSRKQTVQGYLLPSNGLVKVYAPEAGVIMERRVSEGAEVRRGDILFVISNEHGSSQTPKLNDVLLQDSTKTHEALTQQVAKTTELGQVQQTQIRSHIESLNQELAATLKQRDIEENRVALLRGESDNLKLLKDKRLIPDSQYQEQYDKVLAEEFQVQSLEKSITDLKQQITDSQHTLLASSLQTANQLAGFQKELAELHQSRTEIEAKGNYIIQAPVDGTATGILTDPGQEANPNLPLMMILPKGSVLEARLFIPTRAIGFVQPGQQVLLRYDAFPYENFGLYQGTILDISKAILNPNELPVPVTLSEPVYPVTVKLDRQSVRAYGREMPLQAGMVLEADVILNRERLIHWILEPLYRLKGGSQS